ncbi:MAG TPA: DinB family protein [Thermoanaerobaculia bacterium]|nr:DinB family protein [Thermoanaerobaculia bacterium]
MKLSLPDDLAAILRGLDESDREARALLAELDEERFNARPDERSWSVAQCLDHLNVGNRIYLEAMRTAVEEGRRKNVLRQGPFRPRVLERWFIREMEPPPRRRLPAPRKIVPAARKSRAEVGEEWARIQGQLRDLLHEAAPLDLNRTRFVNPFLRLVRFSVGTGFLVIEAHERRHLWQARQVLGKLASQGPEGAQA